MKLVECSDCKQVKRPFCKGICSNCYQKKRRLANPDRTPAGKQQARKPKVGPVRLLCPGDWLEHPNSGIRLGFVWDIDGDSVEVRSYEGNNYGDKPTIKHMTRAKACWYRIIPNPEYGNERPLLAGRTK